ncbi:glycosyltransferase family 2 protein [Desertivirga brevis]|uniref:glycosyltransferase family 2 protein n=1 Tax=Desertivirga brevis TaxID=2810310 RepID=UPI001A95D863|nr:glycosyltransferase [Pedobacter sp. SYSU D00873]
MIPAYNCISYLKETLESVLIQDPGEMFMQIEVVDDCSTDGDVEGIVNEIGKGRVGYFRQSRNCGSLRNFETCINRSKGHYVHLLHGDDRVNFGYYSEIEKLFALNPAAGAAFTDYRYINHVGEVLMIRNPKLPEQGGIVSDFLTRSAKYQIVQPPAITVKRSVYESLGSFYAVHYGEDWEMWTRIASQFPIAFSPKPMAFYRVAHGIGITNNSFRSGQNIKDINKVISIIQNYLPEEIRSKSLKEARKYYAIYSIRVANGLLAENSRAAIKQVEGAWEMSKNFSTFFWMLRFYLMYYSGIKVLLKGGIPSFFKISRYITPY